MPAPRNRWSRPETWLALALLAGLATTILAAAPAYLAGAEPVGDDASSHVLASARLAEHLATGSEGWWLADLNLGFPLAHFYQPLPHVGTAGLALLLGGPGEAALAYKLLAVALLVLLPVSAFLGFRRLGLGTVAALAGAVALLTLSAPKAYYGLTLRHFLVVGLVTLLWGAVFAPLALGEGVRYLTGRGRLPLGVLSFALLFLGHGLLALGMVLVFVFVAFVPPGEAAAASVEAPSPLRVRLSRLVLLGGFTGVVIAFWLLPQLMASDYFSGWPTSSKLRADGFGLPRVLAEWGAGKLTDFHRAPVLAWLSILGTALALWRRRSTAHRVLLFGVVLFVCFVAGRVTFGSLVDWIFPPNRRLEGMMRWVAMLHLFLALAVGVGVGGLACGLARLGPFAGRAWIPGAALLAALLAGTWGGLRSDLAMGLDTATTFLDPRERNAWLEVCATLRNEPAPGRVYASEATGRGSHWDMAYTSLLADKPMALSLGVGVQDSLNYYYLHALDPLDTTPGRFRALCELYGLRYVLHHPRVSMAHLGGRVVAQRAGYRVVEVPGDFGLFDLVAEPVVVPDATPAQVRTEFLRWASEDYPRGARFRRLDEPVALRGPRLPSATLDFARDQQGVEAESAAVGAEDLGAVLAEERGRSRYEARVRVDREGAWLLLKVTPHPFWEARVDGESRPVYTLSPAFMGLALEPGEHRVDFRFRAPGWQKLLLLLSPVTMIGLLLHDRRARRSGRLAG